MGVPVLKTKLEIIEYVMDGLEGEYDNNPNDNGGETFWGVTKVAWQDYTNDSDAEFPPFNFTKDDAYRVYEYFWDKMSLDFLPIKLQIVVFAFGFNAGYGKATKFIQKSLGLKADGIIGVKTLTAYQGISTTDCMKIQYRFVELCVKHYFGLNDFQHFGRGWINRLFKSVLFT
jgi:lysozyme family protein